MSADARALAALARVVVHIGAAGPAMDGLLDEVDRAHAAREYEVVYRLCALIRELDDEAGRQADPAVTPCPQVAA